MNAKPTYIVSSTENFPQDSKYKYDSDSFEIGVDNHASKTISNDSSQFISYITPTPKTILRGAGGNLKVKGVGTVRWKIEDDDGKEHELIIKGCLYVPDMSSCLLSPQHWSQQAQDNFPTNRGTWCATFADSCVMQWDQRKYTKTILYDKNTNTPKMYSVPRTPTFRANLQLCEKVAKTCQIAKTLAFAQHQQKNSCRRSLM